MSYVPNAITNAAAHWAVLSATGSAVAASMTIVAASRPISIASARRVLGASCAHLVDRHERERDRSGDANS
jgi:hypothetical protein